jgi:hypothetical protein
VKINVDMIDTSVILVVLGEHDSGLIVGKNGGGLAEGSEELANK